MSAGKRGSILLALGLLVAGISVKLALPYLTAQAINEPTSSLDAQTEALVHERIFHLFRDACVVSSVHRPHLLSRFDEVAFMEHGRIIDVGTAHDLEERHPAFRVSLEKAAAAAEEGAEVKMAEEGGV